MSQRQGLRVSSPVERALSRGEPVVALESALITHGFARPANLEIARRMQAVIREEGALPAIIAVLEGEPRVGLSDTDLAHLASDWTARKVGLRDLPTVVAQGLSGGTTVAATAYLAHCAGIGVFATGGIGGVHRGHPEDVSADLITLSKTPIVVVCAGAKAILDLARTLEYLETHGVPVVGFGTDEFPAFYSRHSGLEVGARAETANDVARMVQARSALGLSAALLVCVPVPEKDEMPAEQTEAAVAQVLVEAGEAGVRGKALTPFLLARLVELTSGRARRANEALLINNARVAARVAQVLVEDGTRERSASS